MHINLVVIVNDLPHLIGPCKMLDLDRLGKGVLYGHKGFYTG
jgi:hypothetical protein